MPPGNVCWDEFDCADTRAGFCLDDHAAFWSRFACMPALGISWKDDPGVLAYYLTRMDVAERPVVIPLVGQPIGRCWRVRLVTLAS